MQYLIHTPSDVRYLMSEDIDFEVIGPYDETRHFPMVIDIESEEDSRYALEQGLISQMPKE